MIVLEGLGLGQATKCELAAIHYPKPLRFVWHHILPLVCGGKSEPDNLKQLCDNCHYAVHILMYVMRMNQGILPSNFKGTSKQKDLAAEGYTRATAAGTVDKIPKEA